MTLTLVRARVDVSKLAKWAGERGWGAKGRSHSYDEGQPSIIC